jgi:hypothetical protein
MDENRITGTARNIGGKVEEGFGRVTGDTGTQADGVAKQVSGAQPYTTAMIAVGIGWLLGRMHRPL